MRKEKECKHHPYINRSTTSTLTILFLIISLFLFLSEAKQTQKGGCGSATLDPKRTIHVSSSKSNDEDVFIQICTDRIARIIKTKHLPNNDENVTLYSWKKVRENDSLIIDPKFSKEETDVSFDIRYDNNNATMIIDTGKLILKIDGIDKDDSTTPLISFYDKQQSNDTSTSSLLTKELSHNLTHHPITTNNNNNTTPSSKWIQNQNHNPNETVSQSWSRHLNEAIYGGGQHIHGILNYASAPLSLRQYNTEAVIPFWVSPKLGYGLVWDSMYGDMVMNIPENEIDLLNYGDDNKERCWRGRLDGLEEKGDGDIWFWIEICDGKWGCPYGVNVTADGDDDGDDDEGVLLDCLYDQPKIPNYLTCRGSRFDTSSAYNIQVCYVDKDYLSNDYDQEIESEEMYNVDAMTPRIYWTDKNKHMRTSLMSTDTNFIDYYFILADSTKKRMDSIQHTYRTLTGGPSIPLLPLKTYGFWQCKEHYHNQTELLHSASQFRNLHIPIDVIVQDWHYWGNLGWGPHWDPHLYPDPSGMIRTLHDDDDLLFMVSVWSRFDRNTQFYKQMHSRDLLLSQRTTFLDGWNPDAIDLFGHFITQQMLNINVDSIWLDATEPGGNPQLDTMVGSLHNKMSGDSLRNTYSLMISQGVHNAFIKHYQNQKRPFFLTRSSYSHQHITSSFLWSGDISGTWSSLHRQIKMSLNYQLSGMAYWTCDTGGFFRPSSQYDKDSGYHLLLLRWFQFSVFTPVLRVHGYRSDTELWNYGTDLMDLIVRSCLDLRYRLLYYTYSGFRRVENEGYTMQRFLAYDFPEDDNVYDVDDVYMYGDSFLIAPLFTPDSSRDFYVPELRQDQGGAKWFDFYGGVEIVAGLVRFINVDLDEMPILVRSSILVLAPSGMQHAHDTVTEIPRVEVRVYDGVDSEFVWYEDDGVDPQKQRPFTTITFCWKEDVKVLTVGRRMGEEEFRGMNKRVDLYVVYVRPGVGIGVGFTDKPDFKAEYDGTEEMTFDFKQIVMGTNGLRVGKHNDTDQVIDSSFF